MPNRPNRPAAGYVYPKNHKGNNGVMALVGAMGSGMDSGDSGMSADTAHAQGYDTPSFQKFSGEGGSSILAKPGGVDLNSIKAPSFWERAANPSANSGYRGILASILQQQMAGNQNLASIKETGEQSRLTQDQQAKLAGSAGKSKDEREAAISFMKLHDIPYTEENYGKAIAQLTNPSLAAAVAGKQTEQTENETASSIVKTPDYKANQATGMNATAALPFANYISKMPVLGPLQNILAQLSGKSYQGSGVIPTGNTSKSTTGFDPKTGAKTETTTSGATYLPGSIGQSGGQDESYERFKMESNTGSSPAPSNPFGNINTKPQTGAFDINQSMPITNMVNAPVSQRPITTVPQSTPTVDTSNRPYYGPPTDPLSVIARWLFQNKERNSMFDPSKGY